MNEQATRLRPTIIVGAGGTGYETAVRIKARFAEAYPPELLQQIRYVVFDTDTNHPPVRNSLGETIYLEPGLELFQIGGVPVKGIIDNQANYPEIAHELNLEKLPRLDLTKGAKQVRQLGRLAFFYHFQRIRKTIENALRDVLNISHSQRGSAEVQAVNCFFIASACGGTGSGVLLDLAYLTRHLAQKWGIPVDFIFSTGVLVLPEAFSKVPASNEAQIRANAAATLTEVDHFMTYGDFNAHYPDKTHVVDSRPPFSITYLVDASNERNQTVEDLTQLTPIIAEALFLQAGSYLGAQVDSAFDNIPTSTSEDINGYLNSYSMVGASTLRFNATRVRNACAYRLVESVVHDVLLRDDEAPVGDQVQAYFAGQNFSAELLRNTLRAMPDSGQMVVNINTDNFDRVSAEAVVRRVENAIQRYSQETVSDRYLKQIEHNRSAAYEQAAAALLDQTKSIIDQLDGSIPRAQAFLRAVMAEIGPLRSTLQRQRDDSKQELGKLQSQVGRAYEAFEAMAQQFNFWGMRKQPLQQARRRYTEASRRQQQRLLDQAVANQALALLEQVETRADRILGMVGGLKAQLDQIANDADHDAALLQASWRPTHATEEIIDNPQAIESFYARYLNESPLNEARAFAEAKPLSGWLDATEGLKKDLGEWGIGRFARILTDETVEKQIQDQFASERDRRGRLQTLIGKASPFCNYETTYAGQGSDDLDQVLVVGVHDKNSSIFADVQLPKASLVSTFDKDRISVLHTKHGLPLYGLRQFGAYKRHFNTLQARGRAGATPMFGFKSVAKAMTLRQQFALAEAFGVVSRAGASGYGLRTTDYDDEQARILGETLKDAVEHLIAHRDLHAVMQQGIAAWMRAHGHDEAIAALRAYAERPRRQPMPLHDELVMYAQAELARHERLVLA